MILSTTSTIEGKKIIKYLDIIFEDTIMAPDAMKQFTASFKHAFGGRLGEYERELVKMRKESINQLKAQAEELGANAIVGVKIDIETIGGGSNGMMITASGTAVVTD